MIKIFLIMLLLTAYCPCIKAQQDELEQLALNLEKLAQFKQILADLEKGYQVISAGYTTIKDLSQGNFSLHKVFMDGLLAVSPTVKNYKRVADIVQAQIQLVGECKGAMHTIKIDPNFTQQEIAYVGRVVGQLLNQSLGNLDRLVSVLTANQLRMSDAERISSIDGIYKDMEDQLTFLRHFSATTKVLQLQKLRQQNDVSSLKQLYGVK